MEPQLISDYSIHSPSKTMLNGKLLTTENYGIYRKKNPSITTHSPVKFGFRFSPNAFMPSF
jgi:hypothetical protein